MSTIGILSPGHPREPGGVTDLTTRLVRNWSSSGATVSVHANLEESPDGIADRWAAAGTSAVLLHYVPFLYGRRGISEYPEQFALAARERGMRVILFVHEPWVPFTRPQWWILGPLQRRQLRRLVRRVSGAVTPVPAWRDLLSPRPSLHYVGSTLGDHAPKGAEQPLDGPVVFSPFAAGLNWAWITAAVERIAAPTRLIVLGATEEEARAHDGIAHWVQRGWNWRGRLAPADTLAMLARAPLALAPFVDGVTGRRTSIAAELSTGTRVVSSTGPLFDQFFRAGPLDLASSRSDFAELAALRWAAPDSPAEREARIEWYDRTLNPRLLDERLLGLLLGTAK